MRKQPAVGSRRVKGCKSFLWQRASPLMRRSDGYTEKCCAANEEAGGSIFSKGRRDGTLDLWVDAATDDHRISNHNWDCNRRLRTKRELRMQALPKDFDDCLKLIEEKLDEAVRNPDCQKGAITEASGAMTNIRQVLFSAEYEYWFAIAAL